MHIFSNEIKPTYGEQIIRMVKRSGMAREKTYGGVVRSQINRILSSTVEKSVAAQGVNPGTVWLDKQASVEKCVKRCEAVFRMLDPQRPFTVLDIGCGPGLAVPFLEERFGSVVEGYLGIDVSEPLIAEAKKLWPSHRFEVRDIIVDPLPLSFQYTVLNGVLTAKLSLSHNAMENFACDLLEHAWLATNEAMSFNVMSAHVDWLRDDLFHWSLDRAASFCTTKLSRNINIIADYGLYEYTIHVFRSPRSKGGMPVGWQRQ